MSDPGYIYLLINPSMNGLVKIGKTTRNPQERVQELSAATGVPTPFILIFDAFFAECSQVEQYIHTLLESKNYRLSQNREFFTVPVNEAVKAIVKAQGVFSTAQSSGADCESVEDIEYEQTEEPWNTIFELAEAKFYGLNDYLQDTQEALRLYKQAAILGSGQASLMVGCIYRDELNNDQQAITHFLNGVQQFNYNCHAELARVYWKNKHSQNWSKCWSNYFNNPSFNNDDATIVSYGFQYIMQLKQFNLPVDNKMQMMAVRDEILSALQRKLEAAQKANEDNIDAEGIVRYIRYILYPEVPKYRVQGNIKWFKNSDGYGFITMPFYSDIFFHIDAVVDGSTFFQEGQTVEFEIGPSSKGPVAYNVKS